MIAFDPFDNEQYIKLIPDFTTDVFQFSFNAATIQQIDENYTYLLAYATGVSPLPTFSYKPEKKRFPGFTALLLKRTEYVINRKIDGDWKRITVNPSPLETHLLNLFENPANSEFFSKQFSGFINFNNIMFDAIPQESKTSTLPDRTGLLMLNETTTTETFSHCPFKESATNKNNSNGKSYKGYSQPKKEPLDAGLGYMIVKDGLDLAHLILQKLDKDSAFTESVITEQERLAITIAIIMDKLNTR
jgi:hypothetical protein